MASTRVSLALRPRGNVSALRRCTATGLTAHGVCMTRSFASTADAARLYPKSPTDKPPTAILMLNMGGPSTIPEVHGFLRNLFLDRDLMQLPAQRWLAPWIARRRYKGIEEQYEQIGGGSPILRYTQAQGSKMAKLLEELRPSEGGYKSYVGFRYAAPLTRDTMKELKKDGIKRVVAFTQYPQYSCSTTGSSLNEVYRSARDGDAGTGVRWSVIDRWATHPGLIEAFSQIIESTLPQSQSERDETVILFSAHSLPMSVVNRGDPYVAEVAGTVTAVMERLAKKGHRLSHRLVWQSQVGPQPWMGMQTGDAIKGLAKNGVKRVMLVPIAFTSDHIETLFELDIEYGHVAKEAGIVMTRAAALNEHPVFIRALADIVAEHLDAVEGSSTQPPQPPVSAQMMLRCPGCTNETCAEQKQFFARGGLPAHDTL